MASARKEANRMRSWFQMMPFVAALCICGCDSSDATRKDSGQAAGTNSVAAARVASCDAEAARALVASRYDHTHHCFVRRAPLPNLCAIATDSPGGGGELQCFVSPAGDVYAAYMLYGEMFNDPAWHHAVGPTMASTLTESEMALCARFWKDLQRIEDVDTGAPADDRSLWDEGSSAELFPMCEP